jgi:hypothetical protein
VTSGEEIGRGRIGRSRKEDREGWGGCRWSMERKIRVRMYLYEMDNFMSGRLSGLQKSSRASGWHYGPKWQPEHYRLIMPGRH